MTGLLRRLVLATTLALVLPAAAFAGTYTLHPNGFGEHSYSAWKGGEGLPDSTGGKDQALYFQKFTTTTTFAAGVAVFKGFEGASTEDLLPLAFDRRLDGHCGGGAPRFNVRIQPVGTTDPMFRQTVFVGCQAMAPGPAPTDDQGRAWEHRQYAGPLLEGTVVSLSIVFDEGSEFEGFVYLDNIQVGEHVWTSASDNGNGQTIMQDSTALSLLLGEPIALALGY
jgi:hypothetical protein